MSPQFAIDSERLFNVLVVIIVASFFIERALALVFLTVTKFRRPERRRPISPRKRTMSKDAVAFVENGGAACP